MPDMTPTHRNHDMTDKLREELQLLIDTRFSVDTDELQAMLDNHPALAAKPVAALAEKVVTCSWCGSDEQSSIDGACGCCGTEPICAAPQPAPDGEQCARCCGNGEIVTDWDEYLRPPEGAEGDHATMDCPDCDGTGAAPQPAPEDGLTRAQVGAMLDAKRHDREALVEVIREAWQSHEAALRAVLAERDALQGQLNDLRNGWANSVKAHADALAERDALDAIASKLQHDHDMMALANGKLEAERDAAFAAGQESMRERSLAEIALMREDCHPPRTPLVAAVPIWLDVAALRIRQLPIKPRPE